MSLTKHNRAVGQVAAPNPFELAVNRGLAKPVAAPDSFGAVIDAIDESAGRVEAQRLAGDAENNVDKAQKALDRSYRSAMAIQQRQQDVNDRVGRSTSNVCGGGL